MTKNRLSNVMDKETEEMLLKRGDHKRCFLCRNVWTVVELYRCFWCGYWFCYECAKKHFGEQKNHNMKQIYQRSQINQISQIV